MSGARACSRLSKSGGELIHVQVFEACVVVAVRLAGLAVQARRYRGTASASQDFEKHFARCAVSILLAGYRALLQGERTRLMDPGSWARTQNNLGNTLLWIGVG